MPIVKTDTGYWPGYEYKRQVRYTNKDGFTCAIPAEAARVIGYASVGGKSCDDCIRNWEKAMEDWETSNTVTTKVILYRVQRNICMTTRPDVPVAGQDHLSWKCTMSEKDISFCDGMALAVTAGVFEEKAITLNGKVRHNYDVIRDQLPDSIEERASTLEYSYGRPDDVKRLEWTPEREDFFRKIARGMEALILMFEKLQDVETTKQIVDSGGGFALLAAPTQES